MPSNYRPFARVAIPPEVIAAREKDAESNKRNAEILEPRISIYLDCLDAAFADLATVHRDVADRAELDLVGPSREASVWLLSGRVISMSLATMVLLRAGYASEVVPTLRTIHEHNRLIDALALSESDDLLDRWVADESWVRHAPVLADKHESEEATRAEMLAAGVAPINATRDGMRAIYARLSEFSHARRRHLVDAVSVPTRMMPLGPHPDVRVRAATVAQAFTLCRESVTVCGSAFGLIVGGEVFVSGFNPLFHSLGRVEDEIPLWELLK